MRGRRFLGLAVLLVGLLAVVGSLSAEWHRRHQAALDAALDRALEGRNAGELESLVRRGAKPRSAERGEAMLLLAANSGRNLATERLLLQGATVGPAPGHKPGEAETLEDGSIGEWPEAGKSLAHAAGRLEPRTEGWIALGRYEMRRERYAEAADAFRRACKHQPGSSPLARECQIAEETAAAARDLQAQLPAGRSIVAVRPLPPAETSGAWLALEATRRLWQSEPEYTKVRLLLARREARGLRVVWRSSLLDFPGTPGAHFCAMALRMDDFFRRGRPEVLVSERGLGFGRSPTVVHLFRPEGARLVPELTLTSGEEFELTEFGPNGRRQLRQTSEIGWSAADGGMSHAEQPRWETLWGWDGHQFRVVDADYPEAFRRWPTELTSLLKDYPGDPQLLEYLGYAEQILGQRDQARRHYLQALTAVRKALHSESDVDFRSLLQEIRRSIEKRAAALNHTPISEATAAADQRSTPRD